MANQSALQENKSWLSSECEEYGYGSRINKWPLFLSQPRSIQSPFGCWRAILQRSSAKSRPSSNCRWWCEQLQHWLAAKLQRCVCDVTNFFFFSQGTKPCDSQRKLVSGWGLLKWEMSPNQIQVLSQSSLLLSHSWTSLMLYNIVCQSKANDKSFFIKTKTETKS